MAKGKILVTDSLFIFDEHIKKLNEAGYEVERLDKPDASEEELIEALQGKVGYILGGVEKVTENVIDKAKDLKVISFPGIGYKWLIPAWQYAKKKGIMIGITPDAPTHAAAEWAVMAALAMQRGVFEIGITGSTSFKTMYGLEGAKAGIYGLGRIGKEIVRMLQPFNVAEINYYSTNKHLDSESKYGIVQQTEKELLRASDIIFICVPDEVGHNYFDEERLKMVSNDALIVSIAHEGIINLEALDRALARGIRVANDDPLPELSKKYGPEKLFTNLGHNGFNTHAEVIRASDEAVELLINLLEKGEDKNRVI